MRIRRPNGVIRIKRPEEHISLAVVFAFLVTVCIPFQTLAIGGIGLLLLLGIPLLLLCSPVLGKAACRKTWDRAAVLLMLFFIDGIVAYLWSPGFSVDSVYNYLKKVLIVMCFYCLPLNGSEKKLLVGGTVIASMIVSCFLLTQSNVFAHEGRLILAVFGVKQDPNYLGYLFLMPTAVAVHQFMNEKSLWKKAVGLGVALIVMYAVLITGSRGAFLGVATIVAVNVIGKFKTLWGKIAFCTVMAFVALVLLERLLLFLPESLASRFTIQNVLESRGTNRLDIWIATLQAIQREPYKLLLGFGSGASIPTLGIATHNFIFQLLLEVGVVGTWLFMKFFWLWYKRLLKSDLMCLSVLLGCMAMAMTLSVNTIYYFWVTFILCIVCSKARTSEESREVSL